MSTDIKSHELLDGDKSRKPVERDKINMDEYYEVKAWCVMFGVTIADLRGAIEAVGTSALKVKYYLKDRTSPNAFSLKNNLTT